MLRACVRVYMLVVVCFFFCFFSTPPWACPRCIRYFYGNPDDTSLTIFTSTASALFFQCNTSCPRSHKEKNKLRSEPGRLALLILNPCLRMKLRAITSSKTCSERERQKSLHMKASPSFHPCFETKQKTVLHVALRHRCQASPLPALHQSCAGCVFQSKPVMEGSRPHKESNSKAQKGRWRRLQFQLNFPTHANLHELLDYTQISWYRSSLILQSSFPGNIRHPLVAFRPDTASNETMLSLTHSLHPLLFDSQNVTS